MIEHFIRKSYYWDEISDRIAQVITDNFSKKWAICEVGFGGGHFLEHLYSRGYKRLSGIEIRADQFDKTYNLFKKKGIGIDLIQGDVLELSTRYDAIFSTGLIQCFNVEDRTMLIKHLADLADNAIYVVPEIFIDRNEESDEQVAVDGCKEFCTNSILYELSFYYADIRTGRMVLPQMRDSFAYFVCKKE